MFIGYFPLPNLCETVRIVSFGGGREVTNEIMVDGLPTTNPSDQTYTLTPSPDAVQELKVLTTPFSAEYGHTRGGIMMLTSKGGTNRYHGSVYDYFRESTTGISR